MVKSFLAIDMDGIEKSITEFMKKNPTLEINAISHANVVAHGPFTWNQWSALVVFKTKGKS